MLRRLYDWTMRMSAHPRALWVLAAISFIESSVFPIPPDVMLIPMVLANRARAWWIATVCTAASVVGGFLGYAIGYFAYELIGRPVIAFYNLVAEFEAFKEVFNTYGAWIVLIKGMTPIPYKLITILAGVTELDILVFTVASIGARGMRFFLLAGLLWWFGEPIRAFIEKRLEILTLLFCALLVGGFVALKFLF